MTHNSDDYFETSFKKGRGMAQASLDLIEAMAEIAEAAQPITGRGVGYKLFTLGLIPSMQKNEMQRVYRLLKEARERGVIPWEWIVDETRAIERVPTWADPTEYTRCAAQSYRRDFWIQQPHRVQVWSEKGTVRGVLAPTLDNYAVGFFPVHGFTSATAVHDIAEDDDGRPLIVLYIGDFDPSGLYMSEIDLPARFARYNGKHIVLNRIALTVQQLRDPRLYLASEDGSSVALPSFPASDKQKDPRYRWFVQNHGRQCWELDAMDPNDLRDCVEREIKEQIEPVAWERCEGANRAEQESIKTFLDQWAQWGRR
jgi:hypothetical protein